MNKPRQNIWIVRDGITVGRFISTVVLKSEGDHKGTLLDGRTVTYDSIEERWNWNV